MYLSWEVRYKATLNTQMVTTVSVRRKVYSSRERLNIKDIINFKILDLNLHLSSLCRSIFFSSYLTSEGRRGAAGTGSASPSILIFYFSLNYLCFFIWFSQIIELSLKYLSLYVCSWLSSILFKTDCFTNRSVAPLPGSHFSRCMRVQDDAGHQGCSSNLKIHSL